MSDDIVKRLRQVCNGHPHTKIAWPHRTLHDAADRIEALEAENAWLREALEEIARSDYCAYGAAGGGPYGAGVTDGHRRCATIARAALSPTPEQKEEAND